MGATAVLATAERVSTNAVNEEPHCIAIGNVL